MKKIDPAVKKETLFIACFSLIFSVLMQSVFLIIGKWDITVILGNIYGYVVAVGNFFLLGLTVQKSLTKEPDDAKKFIKLSQSARLIMMLIFAVVGHLIPCFNTVSLVIPYVFPRIAIFFRPWFNKK